MEQLRKAAVHPNIHAAMEKWLEAIRNVQARRRDEIINVANRQRSSASRIQEDKGAILNNEFSITQQQGYEQAKEPLFARVVVRLMPSSVPVQMTMFCGALGLPSW
ncbi:meiosis-specific coiled-coil domain-containing protein MEIOC [Trichonephila clavipes]|nr:meiosis-specific coiled-coil domain-containing protein MEIOC [Trichonephila clavipes]